LAPPGVTLDPSSGVLTWTPAEIQGPSTNLIIVQVTDNGSPPLSDAKSFIIVVNEVNVAPTPPVIVDQTIDEMTLFTVNNAATDADLPTNELTYNLLDAPAGASISASGEITWKPSAGQAPSTNTFTVGVTDHNSSAVTEQQLSATNSFTVIVRKVNTAPTLDAIADRTVNVGVDVSFTAVANDTDIPANTLAFSLLSAPVGATIDTVSGLFNWRPSVAQENTTNLIEVSVADNGVSPLAATQFFTVTVNRLSPVLLTVLSLSDPFVIQISGDVGPDYTVQTSITLNGWTNLTTVTPASMPYNVTNADGAGDVSRFFRVLLGP